MGKKEKKERNTRRQCIHGNQVHCTYNKLAAATTRGQRQDNNYVVYTRTNTHKGTIDYRLKLVCRSEKVGFDLAAHLCKHGVVLLQLINTRNHRNSEH